LGKILFFVLEQKKKTKKPLIWESQIKALTRAWKKREGAMANHAFLEKGHLTKKVGDFFPKKWWVEETSWEMDPACHFEHDRIKREFQKIEGSDETYVSKPGKDAYISIACWFVTGKILNIVQQD
jgi:hypothetical protein